MDYSSDENISGELGKRPPRELESPSKIQKSLLLLESTRERTAAKKERSLDVEVLDQLKQKGRIISNRIAGEDRQEKIEVQAGKASFDSIPASLRQDEKGGQAGLKPDTNNLNSIAETVKQENVEAEQNLKVDNVIPARFKQENFQDQFDIQLSTINLNRINFSTNEEKVDGNLADEQRTLKTYTCHFNLLLIYVKKMKSFPQITKGLSLQAPSSKKNTLCRGLAKYLQKVYMQPLETMSSAIFRSALDELVESLRTRIGYLSKNLLPKEKEYYQDISAFSQEKIGSSKKQALMQQRGFSFEAMLKMDLLSLFFYRINEYEKLPQRSRITMIIPSKTILRIFDIRNKKILLFYWRKYTSMQQVLVYDYQEQFHDDITFMCLIYLKNKISNCAYNHKAIVSHNALTEDQILEEIDQPAHLHHPKRIGFKFSQIADINFRYTAIEKYPPHTQLIIFDKIEQLTKEEPIRLVKRQLIKLALQFSVSLKAVLDIYCNMKVKPYFVKFLRKSYQTPLKESLERYNWLSRNKKCSINSILNLDYQVRECVQSRQAHNNPKIQVLCEVAREKYIRLDRIQWCLLNIERQMNNKQPIHISKHEFSFNKIKNNKEQQEDLTAVLILATNGPMQILFKIIAKRTIKDHDFISILVNYLERNEIKGFPLIISEFKRRKFLTENAMVMGLNNFKKICDSQVYFSNNPAYFLVHLLLAEHIYILLHQAEASINKENFHQLFEKNVNFAINGFIDMYTRKYGKL